MKLILLAVALLGVVSAAYVAPLPEPVSPKSIVGSLQQLAAFFPREKIILIAAQCSNDPELLSLIKFLGSDVTQQAVDVFASNEKIIKFVDWLESKGLDVVRGLNVLFELLGLNPIGQQNHILLKANCGGWSGLMSKILQVVDIHEFGVLVKKLWDEDEEFGEMLDKIQSSEEFLSELFQHHAIKAFIIGLGDHGVDTLAISNAIFEFLGWHKF